MGSVLKFIVKLLILITVVGIVLGSRLQTVKYQLTSEKISDSVRLVQISDFHSNDSKYQVEKIITRTKLAKPDYIVLSGDILDSEDINPTISFIRKLNKIAPVIYARGNHDDDYGNYRQFKKELLEIGVYVLDNQSYVVGDLNFIGLADVNQVSLTQDSNYSNNITAISDLVKDNKYNIIIGHRPNYLEAYASIGSDLVLSGHAHGGQWQLPFTKVGLLAPDEGIIVTHVEGEFTLDDTTQIVSTGTSNPYGPWIPRIFNPRQLVIIDLN